MKFSIIVLSYNSYSTVSSAIESALNQTWDDVEVICVDDCSMDGTREILEKYCSCEKFKTILLEKNSGIVCARKAGVFAAAGDYILFLDGDDWLEENTCEVLAGTLSKRDYDILHFGTRLEPLPTIDEEELTDLEQYLPGNDQPLFNKEIHSEYYRRNISFTIWNKCYAAELAKKTYQHIGDRYINMCEDFLFSYICSYFAESYTGIPDKLYHYSIGSGMSTKRKMTLSQFDDFVRAHGAFEECEAFADKFSFPDEHRKVIEDEKRSCILGAIEKLRCMDEENTAAAAEHFINSYGVKDVFYALLEKYFSEPNTAAKLFDLQKLFPVRKTEIKTVGIFYQRMYNGEVERVTSLLSEILSDNGYKVVVITNEPENPKDYPLAEGAVRKSFGVTIPETYKDYRGRFEQYTELIEANEIDAVIYNAWLSPILFWDMMAIKAAGAACLVHCHGAFISALSLGNNIVAKQAPIYRYADGVITLSEADRLYWQRFNRNTFCVTNPSTFSTDNTPPADLEGHRILWLSRADAKEKNPMDALQILRDVLKSVPDAKLCIAGYIPPETKKEFDDYLNEQGISDHVEFPGYSIDVNTFFIRSSVLLLTSDFEGFPMTILESLTSGVPVVCYAMPYLTMCRDSEAIKQVGWKNIKAAADEISKVLLDDELRYRRGKAAREEAKRLESIDLGKTWKNILDSVVSDTSPDADMHIDPRTFNEVVETYETATAQLSHAVSQMQRTIIVQNTIIQNADGMYTPEQVQSMLREIYNSKRYRVGKAIVFLPAKVRTAFLVLKQHGFAAVLRVVKNKLLGREISPENIQ